MKRLCSVLGCLFGYSFLALCLLIAVNTVGRGLRLFSIIGTGEISAYIMALCAGFSFIVASVHRTHIRIDILVGFFSENVQGFLNWLAMFFFAISAGTIFVSAAQTLKDTLYYNSKSTVLAISIQYPQMVWVAGLGLFFIVVFILFVKSTLLLLKKDISALNHDYQPKAAQEEVAEEIADLIRRKV